MFDNFITLDMLNTFLVAVSVTVMLTQFFKDAIDWVWFKLWKKKTNTKYIVFIFAVLVIGAPLAVKHGFYGILNFETIFTTLLNAVLLSLTAMKSYESIVNKDRQKRAKENNTVIKK